MPSAARIPNYAAQGVAQLISMYSKPRGALVALLPVILAVTPNVGPQVGGTLFRISGYNFESVSSVTIGGAPATGLIIGGGIITGFSPASGSSGAKDVVVTGPAGAATSVGGFTYTSATLAPSIVSANFSQGDIAGGGLSIVLTGTNLLGVTTVTILGASVAPSATTASTVTFTLPAHAAAVGTMSVTSPGGTSGTLPFEYWSPVQIAGVAGVYDAEKGITATTTVSAWADQSAAGLNLAQATGANQPGYGASTFGTLHGLTFTGAHVLSIGAQHLQASGRSAFWVGKYNSSQSVHSGYSGDNPLTVVGDGSGGVNVNAGHNAGTLSYQNFNAGWTETTAGSALNDGAARLYGWTHDTSGNLKAYVGATQQGATVTGQTYAAGTTGWNNIGQGFGGSADGFVGSLGAVVIVDGVISAGDLTKQNAWAQQRYGTP